MRTTNRHIGSPARRVEDLRFVRGAGTYIDDVSRSGQLYAVVLRSPVPEAELLGYCKERLADFKRPKQIHITDAIPRTATGKIQRRIVAEAYRTKP